MGKRLQQMGMVWLLGLVACAAAEVALLPQAQAAPHVEASARAGKKAALAADPCRSSEQGRRRPLVLEEEQVLMGRVVRIIDGDTIDVLDASKTPRRIRLDGIDTPERGKPFYQRASQHLADLVFGKDVEVRWQKIDPYNRCVGKVWVADPACTAAACPKSLDANLAQIEAGYAWWFRRYAREQRPEDRASYEAAERQAREARRGLWVDPDPRPPWEGRSKKQPRKKEPRKKVQPLPADDSAVRAAP